MFYRCRIIAFGDLVIASAEHGMKEKVSRSNSPRKKIRYGLCHSQYLCRISMLETPEIEVHIVKSDVGYAHFY